MAELVDATDSKSVELRFMSVRVGLGVPIITKCSSNTIFHKINDNSCVSNKTYNFPFSLENNLSTSPLRTFAEVKLNF